MATYKLIQDIEAEDHILGPLSLRQFIFALIAVFCFYICFISFVKHVIFLLVFFLPPGLFCAFFAVPFGRDQSTEIWALAKLRFWFKPRRRIWDQSGVKELVTITVPKKVERVLTNGLTQNEVQSRLKALANTIDSRGWATKNVNLNTYTLPDPLIMTSSDRLIDIASVPQAVPSYDIQASDDILDETSNPVAQQFDSMITASSQAHHQQLISKLDGIRSDEVAKQQTGQADYWFLNRAPSPPGPSVAQTSPASTRIAQPSVNTAALPLVAPPPDLPNEDALSAQLKAKSDSQQTSYSHLRTLQPLSPTQQTTQTATAVTALSDPDILSLANNNDLNVSTLAREADKATSSNGSTKGEVIISLH